MKTKPPHGSTADTTTAVDAFMATLEHASHADIQRLRSIVLAVDPSIREGIKWNAPSFRTSEYFATVHLRCKIGIAVILHRGAKLRELPADAVPVDDPDGLLKWLGEDRAMVEFRDRGAMDAKAAAFRALLKQWIARV